MHSQLPISFIASAPRTLAVAPPMGGVQLVSALHSFRKAAAHLHQRGNIPYDLHESILDWLDRALPRAVAEAQQIRSPGETL